MAFCALVCSAPPDISVEKTWIHAAEGCDIQLACTLHGDVNSEVSFNYFLAAASIKLLLLTFTDDVVPELVLARSNQPTDHVQQGRRKIRPEHHKLPHDGFRQLQVSLIGRESGIDYRADDARRYLQLIG